MTMPTEDEYGAAADEAVEESEKATAAERKKFETVTDEDIAAACPEPADGAELKAIVEAVKEITDKNERKAKFNAMLTDASAAVKRGAEKLFDIVT